MKSALACMFGTMDMVRPFGLAGIDCAVIANPQAPVRDSKFTVAAIEWADPMLEPELLLRRLIEFSSTQAQKPVLFYQYDTDLMFVSHYRDKLREHFEFVVADPFLVEVLVDKTRFQELAHTHDLPVPESIFFNARTHTASDLTLEYPFILKPVNRELETFSLDDHAKALEVANLAELEQLWPELEKMGMDFLAQRLIQGPESAIESYHVYVDDTGEIVASFTGKKIRTLPPRYGHSTALETTSASDVDALGAEITKRIGLTGIAKFDFKRSPEGQLFLLEINPRFNLWHHLGSVAGVNLPALVYDDLTNRPRRSTGPARSGVRYCRLNDWRAARAVGISTMRWAAFMLGSEARTVSLGDLAPLARLALRKAGLRVPPKH